MYAEAAKNLNGAVTSVFKEITWFATSRRVLNVMGVADLGIEGGCLGPNQSLQWTGPGANRGVKFGPFSFVFIASDRRSCIWGPATELGSLGRVNLIEILPFVA